MALDYSDQTKIFDPGNFGLDVHFVGAGGALNSAIVQLATMGAIECATIHVWDPDILEEHNCATELSYSNSMVGQPKVTAVEDALRHKFGDSLTIIDSAHLIDHQGPRPQVILHAEAVTADTPLSGIVITGVDSMAARQEIWQAIEQQAYEIPLLIDTRSAGLDTLIITFDPSDFDAAETYAETLLYSDAESMQLECGARNVCFISAYIGAEVCHRISIFARGLFEKYAEELFSVPRTFD